MRKILYVALLFFAFLSSCKGQQESVDLRTGSGRLIRKFEYHQKSNFDVVARSDDAGFISYFWDQTCGTEIEDFISLAECKEQIISNSTFSWWAAYLSGGKVVAPKEWFAGALAKRCTTKDLLPENWILI